MGLKHYYILYPRNFVNEYKLYSAEAKSPAENELIERGYDRITRKEAGPEGREGAEKN